MRRLMLLRHAKAEPASPGLRDHDRALTPRGHEAAAKIGAYMATHALVPDLVVSSTAARARETLDPVAAAFPERPRIVYDERIYDASAEAILSVVKAAAGSAHVVLLVGHNPGFADLADLLIAAGDVEARQRLAEKLPTGGFIVIDFPIDAWSKLHPKSGRLDRFVLPRALTTATD